MVFNLGTRHDNAPIKETFFGYFKNDGFVKRKYLGRIEKNVGLWNKTEQEWLNLYFSRTTKTGMSVTKSITATDEWLAEAYMETDYSDLTSSDFEQVVRNFFAYGISTGGGENDSN